MKELIEQIKKYNRAYRSGTPLISDEEYDILLSKLSPEELDNLKDQFLEEKGPVKHNFVIGSLEKIKAETQDLEKWISKKRIKTLFVSEKIDGMSFVAFYQNGNFISGATRGDGYYGQDITEKLKLILPLKINFDKDLMIRGELTLTGNDHILAGMKNRRNGTVGLINRDDVDQNLIKLIKSKIYQILNLDLDIENQFDLIKKIGFESPKFICIPVDNLKEINQNLIKIYNKFKKESDYDIDGLVVSSNKWKNENDEFRPKNKIAFKINSEGIETTVTNIIWETCKGGFVKPIIEFEPREIDGALLRRASGFNAKFIIQKKISIGSKIKIIRSGGIIPKIIDVEPNNLIPKLPSHCESCRSELKLIGVDLKCSSDFCETSEIKKISFWIRNLGFEGITEISLKKWKIFTFNDIILFRPDPKSKNHIKFQNFIDQKIWNNSIFELFSNLHFKGAAKKTIEKIVDFYKIDLSKFEKNIFENIKKFPKGISYKTIENLKEDWDKNIEIVKTICSDPRWNGSINSSISKNKDNVNKKVFVITGTLSKKRSEVEKYIKSKGHEVSSSISSKVDFLIAGENAGSKLEKAKKIGSIKIISERELDLYL